MQEESREFLKRLLESPSPSGYEQPIQDVVREWASHHAEKIETDTHGNVDATHNPGGSPIVMLAGHCDQIGLMVQHIDDQGFLFVQPVGGWYRQSLLGQKLTVWSNSGPIQGVLSRKATHLMTSDEKKKVPDWTDVWIDIGANDRKEIEDLIGPGDPVTLDLGFRELRNGMVTAPGLDDKSGLWTVMETLRLLKELNCKAEVHCVSTVQEEIGLRGARTSCYSIKPDVGIAVDVCHSADIPGSDKRQLGDTRLGNGPVVFRGPNVSPVVHERLTSLAEQHEIPIQVRGAPRATGTDANAIQITGDGVATALIGIPNRYMHSPVEVVSTVDLKRASQLLAQFCASLTPDMKWTP